MQRNPIRPLFWFAAAIIFVSAFGTRWESIWNYVFGGTSDFWKGFVMNLQWFDQKLLEWGMFPSGIALGLILMFVAYFGRPIWDHLHRYTQNRDAFEQQFRALEFQKARQDFRWGLEKAYRIFMERDVEKHDQLHKFIKEIVLPSDLPLAVADKGLIEYAKGFHILNDSGDIFGFCHWLFGGVITPKNTLKAAGQLLIKSDLDILFEGRRITSTFWDAWARKIREGRLRVDDIRIPLESNKLDIKMLVLSEIAIAYYLRWDDGPGKLDLFMLGTNEDRIESKKWHEERKKFLDRET